MKGRPFPWKPCPAGVAAGTAGAVRAAVAWGGRAGVRLPAGAGVPGPARAHGQGVTPAGGPDCAFAAARAMPGGAGRTAARTGAPRARARPSTRRWPGPVRPGLFLLLGLLVLLAAAYAAYPLPLRGLIEREAAACGVDPLLLAAVIRRESGFETRAVSDRGARGLMQVMPATGAWVAREMGLGRFHPDLLFDPAYNVRVGCWYLAYLLRRFEGDPVAALAAYNGGEGTVGTWMAAGDWHPSRGIADIPFPETRLFVGRVLQDYRIYDVLYRRLPSLWASGARWLAERLAP